MWEDESQMFAKSYASLFSPCLRVSTATALLIEHNSVICMKVGKGKGHLGECLWMGLIKGYVLINQNSKGLWTTSSKVFHILEGTQAWDRTLSNFPRQLLENN